MAAAPQAPLDTLQNLILPTEVKQQIVQQAPSSIILNTAATLPNAVVKTLPEPAVAVIPILQQMFSSYPILSTVLAWTVVSVLVTILLPELFGDVWGKLFNKRSKSSPQAAKRQVDDSAVTPFDAVYRQPIFQPWQSTPSSLEQAYAHQQTQNQMYNARPHLPASDTSESLPAFHPLDEQLVVPQSRRATQPTEDDNNDIHYALRRAKAANNNVHHSVISNQPPPYNQQHLHQPQSSPMSGGVVLSRPNSHEGNLNAPYYTPIMATPTQSETLRRRSREYLLASQGTPHSVMSTQQSQDHPHNGIDPMDFARTICNGANFLKFGRFGRPHQRRLSMRMYNGKLQLYWQTGELYVDDIQDVVAGKQTKVYDRRENRSADATLCFSILTKKRTLDLMAENRSIRDFFVDGIKALANIMDSPHQRQRDLTSHHKQTDSSGMSRSQQTTQHSRDGSSTHSRNGSTTPSSTNDHNQTFIGAISSQYPSYQQSAVQMALANGNLSGLGPTSKASKLSQKLSRRSFGGDNSQLINNTKLHSAMSSPNATPVNYPFNSPSVGHMMLSPPAAINSFTSRARSGAAPSESAAVITYGADASSSSPDANSLRIHASPSPAPAALTSALGSGKTHVAYSPSPEPQAMSATVDDLLNGKAAYGMTSMQVPVDRR